MYRIEYSSLTVEITLAKKFKCAVCTNLEPGPEVKRPSLEPVGDRTGHHIGCRTDRNSGAGVEQLS